MVSCGLIHEARVVVEGDDRDVARHVEACVGEGLVGAEREAVVEADERGGPVFLSSRRVAS